MPKYIIRLAIVLIIIIEIAWLLSPSHKSTVGERFRNTERLAALEQAASQPSAVNQAAVKQEMKILYEHILTRKIIIFIILIAIDAIFIYLFWNRSFYKHASIKATH